MLVESLMKRGSKNATILSAKPSAKLRAIKNAGVGRDRLNLMPNLQSSIANYLFSFYSYSLPLFLRIVEGPPDFIG